MSKKVLSILIIPHDKSGYRTLSFSKRLITLIKWYVISAFVLFLGLSVDYIRIRVWRSSYGKNISLQKNIDNLTSLNNDLDSIKRSIGERKEELKNTESSIEQLRKEKNQLENIIEKSRKSIDESLFYQKEQLRRQEKTDLLISIIFTLTTPLLALIIKELYSSWRFKKKRKLLEFQLISKIDHWIIRLLSISKTSFKVKYGFLKKLETYSMAEFNVMLASLPISFSETSFSFRIIKANSNKEAIIGIDLRIAHLNRIKYTVDISKQIYEISYNKNK